MRTEPNMSGLVPGIVAMTTIVLVAAAVLRGQHAPNHDEVHFLETGLRMLGSYGNPQDFWHGSFLYDLMAIMQGGIYLARGIAGSEWDPDAQIEFYLAHRDLYLLAGRLMIVLFAALLLVAVNRLSGVLYGGYAGPLSTALLAFGVLLLLTGSLLKEDVPASVLGVLSTLVLFDTSMKIRMPVRWSLSGALYGAAVATKYTLAPLVLIPVIWIRSLETNAPRRLILLFLAGTGAAFLAVEPFVVLDISSTIHAYHIMTQNVGTNRQSMAPRYLLDYLPLGLGIPLMLCAAPAMIRILFGQDIRLKAIVAYLVVGGAICMTSTFGVPRYLMPLAPFLCMIVAGEIGRLDFLKVRQKVVVVGMALLLVWPANIIAFKYLMLLSRPDTRNVTQAWIEARIPTGSKVLVEGAITFEPSYAPALVPTPEWFEARQREAQEAGSSGRIFKAAAVRAAQGARPRYDLVYDGIENVTDFKEIGYLVLSNYDSLPGEWFYNVKADEPDVHKIVTRRQMALKQLGKDFAEVFAVRPVPNLRYDLNNNPDFWQLWAAPFRSYDQWMAGPQIKIYQCSVK